MAKLYLHFFRRDVPQVVPEVQFLSTSAQLVVFNNPSQFFLSRLGQVVPQEIPIGRRWFVCGLAAIPASAIPPFPCISHHDPQRVADNNAERNIQNEPTVYGHWLLPHGNTMPVTSSMKLLALFGPGLYFVG